MTYGDVLNLAGGKQRLMTLGATLRKLANSCLMPFNYRLDNVSADRAEKERLEKLAADGHFDRAVLPLLPQFAHCDPRRLLELVARDQRLMARFRGPAMAPEEFSLQNSYFTSPDAEIAYSIVRDVQPACIIEVGSGNSTRLFRAALRDAGLSAELVSIDPAPRAAVNHIADRVLQMRVENVRRTEIADALKPGDILFIDSSHDVRVANDVVELFLNVLPLVKPGVLIHVHDIFLPYDYPREWVIEYNWPMNEQYLVHALLCDSKAYEVVWAGHYFQRTMPDFWDHFQSRGVGIAASLWLRKVI